MGRPNPMSSRRVTPLASATTIALIAALLTSTPAAAAAAEEFTPPQTVSSDPLPTPQINGVVWDQEIVGDTVYVAGEFTRARPAGAAAGVDETPRTHLLAYQLSTGALLPWAPDLDAQVRQLAVSPDGTRVYAVGDFTSVNGVSKNRIAAFTTASGALDAGFTTSANNRIHAIAVTATTVYLGGHFSSISGVTRVAAAAVDAATGAVTGWQPQLTDGRAYAMVISPDQGVIVIGGDFTKVNGSNNPGYGLAAVDAATGALTSWAANGTVRNAGEGAAIYSLDSDGDSVYGTGYVFKGQGNLEGAFRADWVTGTVHWVQDCHGDTYSVAAQGDIVYTAGHAHYCGNVDGFPEYDQHDRRLHYRAVAFSKETTGTLMREPYGYHNWQGTPSPSILNWFPAMNLGSYTKQYQGPWSVDASAQYVVYGGEFTTVNGQAQQGLVRFAVRDIAPNADGPRLRGDDLAPTLTSTEAGTMVVSWPASHDRDDTSLTYHVYRDGALGTPVHTTTVDSRFWDRPTISWIDTGLTPGQTYSYRVRAVDPWGNDGWGTTVSGTVATAGTLSPYARAVIYDQPTHYWRLGEGSGTTARDTVGRSNASKGSRVDLGAAGAIIGDPDTAASFRGSNSSSLVASQEHVPTEHSFTIETWVKTTSTAGGKIVGFGSARTGESGNYDRHVYMNTAGNILFGVHPGSSKVVQSPKAYNDGAWHHVVATLGAGGMQLYIDGVRVGYDPSVTYGQIYWGYWRIGGDNTWTGARYLIGTIDETAIYPRPLTHQQVLEHYTLSGRTADLPEVPTDEYGATVFDDDPLIYHRLGEISGMTANDAAGGALHATYSGSYTLGDEGGVRGTSDTAVSFAQGAVINPRSYANPSTFSTEIWFKTTTTRGGKLTGFGNRSSGLSTSYDRHVYMQDDGRLVFGTYTGVTNTTTSPEAYNDGEWHHVVATQSSAGMRLFVDGELVGTHSQTAAENYTGYWRAGGDTTWGSTDAYFAGTLDEFAVYPRALTPAEVAEHYAVGGPLIINEAPTAAFTSSVDELAASFDAGASADPEGLIASYRWDFGDSTPAVTTTESTTSHAYAASGTYTVTLTVTDVGGLTATASEQVTVTAPPPPVSDLLVSDDFARSLTSGWGAAETGGDYTLSRAASSSVASGTGFLSHTAGSTRSAILRGVSATDVDLRAEVSADKPITGGGAYAGIVLRDTGSDYYQARVRFLANGGTALQILQGGSTVLANVALPATYTPGDTITVRGQITGTSPTVIAAKAWPSDTAEPIDWALSVTSDAAGIQSAGAVGIVSYASGSLTNAPLAVGVHRLVAHAGTAPDAEPEPPIEPEEPPVDPEDPPVDPEDPPVDPEDPPVDPEDPPVDPGEPAASLATDDFERASAAGWGSATSGGAWSSSVNGSYVVDSGAGAFIHTSAGSTRRALLNEVSTLDVEQQVTISVDTVAQSGHIVAGLVSRQGEGDFLQGRVRLLPDGVVALQILRGSSTLLGNASIPGLTYAPGEALVLKVRTTGTGATTIEAKVWRHGTPEPAEWQLSASDATPALQVAGVVGLESYLSGSAPNAPVTVRYDDYSARLPE